jgi:hypothetical protein
MRATTLTLIAALVAAGCIFPHATHATLEPVDGPVTVSADGRRVTAIVSTGGCRPSPTLVASAAPGLLKLEVSIPPEYSGTCAGVGVILPVRARLTKPLGARRLVQASNGTAIAEFDEHNLAAVTLPTGFRLASDSPLRFGPLLGYASLAGTPVGDSRIYAGPDNATLQVSQILGAPPLLETPGAQAGPTAVTATVTVNGQPATLWSFPSLVIGVTWLQDGYRFVVTSGGVSAAAPPPDEAMVLAVANSVKPAPGAG